MYQRKIKVKVMEIILFSLVILLYNTKLFCQNFFPLGIYSYEAGTAYTFNANEQQLLSNINTNYITGMFVFSQDDIMTFYESYGGSVRVGLEHDPAYQSGSGPYSPYPDAPNNTILWAYISENQILHPTCRDTIEQFIHNVDSIYNHPLNQALYQIRVAHQGWMDSTNHWPYIRFACNRIQHYFGNDVQSSVIHNVFHWESSRLDSFFHYMDDSLDVYQHEYYPFYTTGQDYSPDDTAAFQGNDFQYYHIDTLFLGSFDSTKAALDRSGNDHTTLEAIIQTFSAMYPDTTTTPTT